MNTDKEKAAIQAMISDWLDATNQAGEAGADGYAAFVTKDAVMLPPNEARINGRAAIREMALGFTAAKDFKMRWKANQIDVSADGGKAHAIGEFEYSLKDADGNAVSDKGKFLDTFEKQPDGSWLCTVGSWNSDLPAH